jgi:hypothetical protein
MCKRIVDQMNFIGEFYQNRTEKETKSLRRTSGMIAITTMVVYLMNELLV